MEAVKKRLQDDSPRLVKSTELEELQKDNN